MRSATSRWPDGGWVATHIDITEQRRAEQELDETRQFLDSIIENIPVSVVVKDAKTRKYLLVNRAFETMLGIPRSEMLDRTAFDIHRPQDAKNIDDADTESVLDADHVNYKEIEVNTHGARAAHAVDPPHRHQGCPRRSQIHHSRHRGRYGAEESGAAHRVSGAP